MSDQPELPMGVGVLRVQRQRARDFAAANTPPPEPVDPLPTEAPVNVDVPYASQTDAVLSCTMGNWENVPTSYAYLWILDGMEIGTDETYTVIADDIGSTAVCVVTATNGIGSTTAPPSNEIVVA